MEVERWEECARTGDDLDIVAGDELDGLLALGRHVGGCVVTSAEGSW